MNIVSQLLFNAAPPEHITVSEWADSNRFLSREASAEYGRWRTSRTPYLKKIMDCLSDDMTYERVVVMKGAQLGFTEAGNNWIGYVIDHSPAPILMVQPTEDMVKRNSKMRIEPMIMACPSLSDKVSINSRDKNNTIKQKKFPGGTLLMACAESPAGLRSLPIKNLFLDEVDAYPYDLDGEGSPISLAEARTRTFRNKKIFIISTPTVKNGSAIESEFVLTDQQYFHVPCPHCGDKFVMRFDYLVWEKGKYDEVKMACPHCGALIEEKSKTDMMSSGEWIPSHPELSNIKTIGFHISSLYSPYGWRSWADICHDFDTAQNDPSKMKTFVNTDLGEVTEEKGEQTDWRIPYGRREEYEIGTIPSNDVIMLTCGVDVQKDRLELQVVGWTKTRQSYSIDYRVLLGNTTQDDVWFQLNDVINEIWEKPDGSMMTITRTAIDSGYNTSEVYKFCRDNKIQVIPIKGQDRLDMYYSPPRKIDYTRNGKKIGGVKQWNIGVSKIKKEFYSWLSLENPKNSCYCHFPQYDEKFFEGLCAEAWDEKKKKWVKKYERNEPLDTWVYARAVSIIEGLDRQEKQEERRVKVEKKKNTDFYD